MSDITTAVVEVAEPPGWRQHIVKALAAYDGPRLDDPGAKDKIEFLAKCLAGSVGIIPDQYVGAPNNVVAGIMQASRLNIPVMTALTDIYYDGGGMAMKASLIQLLVRRAGHAVVIHRTDPRVAVIEIQRGDGRPGGVVEWTIGEATVAGLVAGQMWQDYPADCLFARAMARAARRHAADATGGTVYVQEELQSGYADGGDADAGLLDRTVAEPVAALLADLDGLKYAAVRDRWNTAVERRLLNAYAADGPAGQPLTVGAVLRDALERTMPKPRPAPPVSGAGVGGSMRCGCAVDVVLATGDHQSGCAQHVGATPDLDEDDVPPPPAPAAEDRPARRKAKKSKAKRGGRRGGRR